MFSFVVLLALASYVNFADAGLRTLTDADENAAVDRHNLYRRQLGVQDVAWSNDIAVKAANWAEKMAADGIWAHSATGGEYRDNGKGENLYYASGTGSYDPQLKTSADLLEAAVQSWTSEYRWYSFPEKADAGFKACDRRYSGLAYDYVAEFDSPYKQANKGLHIGHFTQVVWEATTKIGCAVALNGNKAYVVCQYGPGGNYINQLPFALSGRDQKLKDFQIGTLPKGIDTCPQAWSDLSEAGKAQNGKTTTTTTTTTTPYTGNGCLDTRGIECNFHSLSSYWPRTCNGWKNKYGVAYCHFTVSPTGGLSVDATHLCADPTCGA